MREGGGEALTVVVATRRRAVGDVRGALGLVCGVVIVGAEVQIAGLASQEGCACLVVRNFGRKSSREGRLEWEWI